MASALLSVRNSLLAVALYITLLELLHPFDFLDQSWSITQSLLAQTTFLSYHGQLWAILVILLSFAIMAYAAILHATVRIIVYCVKTTDRSSSIEECINHEAAVKKKESLESKANDNIFRNLTFVFVFCPLLVFNGAVVNRDLDKPLLEGCLLQTIEVAREAIHISYYILAVILVIGFMSTGLGLYRAFSGTQKGSIRLEDGSVSTEEMISKEPLTVVQ